MGGVQDVGVLQVLFDGYWISLELCRAEWARPLLWIVLLLFPGMDGAVLAAVLIRGQEGADLAQWAGGEAVGWSGGVGWRGGVAL